MAIKMPEKQEGGGIGKFLSAGKTVLGLATGNPLMALTSAAEGAKNSPIGRALSAVGTVGEAAGGMMGGGAPAITGAVAPGGKPNLGLDLNLNSGSGLDAMKRRYSLGGYGG